MTTDSNKSLPTKDEYIKRKKYSPINVGGQNLNLNVMNVVVM